MCLDYVRVYRLHYDLILNLKIKIAEVSNEIICQI